MKHIFASAMILIGLISVGGLYVQAQPTIYQVETPYLPLRQPVKMAGNNYGAGVVSYGPVGTPVTIHGANFGTPGTVSFPGTTKGSTVSATVSSWSSGTLVLAVPSGATTGYVAVTASGQTSNYVPFIVTRGSYSASCPTSPPSTLLAITTTSLPSGTQNSSYSTTLQATGGQPPYTWLQSGSLLAGLSLNRSSGVISGTPTWSGTDDMTVTVTDFDECNLKRNAEPLRQPRGSASLI